MEDPAPQNTGTVCVLVMKTRADIPQDATPKNRMRFLQNCIFVCLHASAKAEDSSEFLEKDEEKWLKLFSGLVKERISSLQNPDEEIYLASLLWGLLESAEGRVSSLYCLKSKSSRSSGEALIDLVKLLGIKAGSQTLRFGDITQEDANRILSRGKLFEGAGDVSVAGFTSQICRYVPLGPQGTATLPDCLSHAIRDETAKTIWMEM